jgi:hypothetical protein
MPKLTRAGQVEGIKGREVPGLIHGPEDAGGAQDVAMDLEPSYAMVLKDASGEHRFWYLANACGETTGYGTLDLTDEDLNKVPFEDGPGVVLPYLIEMNGEKFVMGNLEVCYQDEAFWGDFSKELLSEAEALDFCERAVETLRSRAEDWLVLPVDDTMPDRFIVSVAFPLASVKDAEETRARLARAFGEYADPRTSKRRGN